MRTDLRTEPEGSDFPASPTGARSELIQRAEGVELIGEFEGSGFRQPRLLARRADGQVVQLTKLLYAVAEAADGHRDAQGVSEVVSERCGRDVTANNVALLADRKLRPLGVLALPDGTTPVLKKRPPVMALRHRKPVLSENAVQAGARAFTWLHLPFVQISILLAVVAFDVWLFGMHGIAPGLRTALYDPVLLLAVVASVVVATGFHEFGHASACRYSGARPGVMGVGLYLVWPVFYCDVTDAYRLKRSGRLRTDLGGIYFNAIFALLSGAVYLVTGQQVALLAAVVQHMIILQQLIPLMRFDGYYVLTDLTGVPDILSRIKPIFRSLLRGREREPRVAELKPWVRVVVTAYLVTLVPTLLLLFSWMIMATPRLLATVQDSFALQLAAIHQAGVAEVAAGAVRTAILGLQLGAIGLSLGRTGGMAGRGLVRWSHGSVPRRTVATMGVAALLGFAGCFLWPGGNYQPIQPGERGTVGDGISSLSKLPTTPAALASSRVDAAGSATGPQRSSHGVTPGERGGSDRSRSDQRGALGNGRWGGGGGRTGSTGDGTQGTGGGGGRERGKTSSPAGPTPSPPASGVGASAPPPTSSSGTTTSPTTTDPTSPGSGADGAGVVVNQTDNSDIYRLVLDIRDAAGNVVDTKNVAAAIASCEACRTVVVSLQAVLVTGDPQIFVPENFAVSRNVNCVSCETLAFASQLILQTDGPFGLSAQGKQRIKELRRELEALAGADLPLDELLARIKQLNQEFAQVMLTEVTAVAPPAGGGAPTGSEATQAAGDSGGGSAGQPGGTDTPSSSSPTDMSDAPTGSPSDPGTTTTPSDTGTTTETPPTDSTPTDPPPTESAPTGTGTSTTTTPTTQDTSTTPTPTP